MKDRILREYRKARRPKQYGSMTWWTPAVNALAIARTEDELLTAEFEGRIRFLWEGDQDFRVDDFYGFEEPEQSEATEELRSKIASGEWVAECCIPQIQKQCPHCGTPLEDEWVDADICLGGIVHAPGDEYVREVERDLFYEALPTAQEVAK